MAFARRPAKNKTPINRSPCTTGSPPGRYVDPPRWRSWRSRQSKPASYVCSQLFPPTPVPSCEDSTLQALCPTKRERTTKGRLFCVPFCDLHRVLCVSVSFYVRRSHVHRSNSRIDPDCRHDCRTTAAGPTGPTGPTGRTAGSSRSGSRELQAGDCRASEEARGWRLVDGAPHVRRLGIQPARGGHGEE